MEKEKSETLLKKIFVRIKELYNNDNWLANW